VQSIAWDKDGVGWTQFDAVVVCRMWDYHLKYEAFLGWIQHLEKQGVRLINPPHMLRWNSNKQYLFELQQRGVSFIDTVLIEPDDSRSLQDIMHEAGWAKAVYKPVIGLSGHGAGKVLCPQDATEMQDHYEESLRTYPMFVQEYMESVDTIGEYSLVFLGGRFSHARLMKPQDGLSRGESSADSIVPMKSNSRMIEAAQNVMDALLWEESPAYDRVDMVEDSRGVYRLMEVELIEPGLYLDRESGKRFANVIEESFA
jgi:glutathione synthase/RimK-type ligase-like ATP-grasp enzyme